jgi:transglycosylase-like protein with SLT domain
MHRLKCLITVLAMLLVLTLHVWSQTQRCTVPAASVEDSFAAYRQALDRAADSTLANVMPGATRSDQKVEAVAKTAAMPDEKALHRFAQRYWSGNDEAVRRAVARVTRLRPILIPILREEGIPEETAAIVLIESAGQAAALSPKGARGIWQFMPNTARRYGLEVTVDRDDRIEVVKSTRAAASYLRNLYQRFGDWRLAFAAYNAGEQVVEQAATRTGHTDFSRIERALPAETRTYVPAVIRAMALLGLNKRESSPVFNSERSPSKSVLYASTKSAD